MIRSQRRRGSIGMALVGLGKVSAAHAAALGEVPGSRFIGVLDTDPERTRVAASRYGVRPYRSLDELLEDRAVDAITVCTPHRAHAATAIAAASAGRHVLV